MKPAFVILSLVCALPALALDPLQCAEGTRLTGDEPPEGTQQQCVLPDGTLHGEQRVWYHDGTLMELRHFDHGKEHGEQQGWWPNGQLMMQGVSVQGKRYSGYKYWDVAGNPTKVETATVPETSLPDVEQKPADQESKDKEVKSEKTEGEENEPLQDATDQSQLKNVAPLPPASIP